MHHIIKLYYYLYALRNFLWILLGKLTLVFIPNIQLPGEWKNVSHVKLFIANYLSNLHWPSKIQKEKPGSKGKQTKENPSHLLITDNAIMKNVAIKSVWLGWILIVFCCYCKFGQWCVMKFFSQITIPLKNYCSK